MAVRKRVETIEEIIETEGDSLTPPSPGPDRSFGGRRAHKKRLGTSSPSTASSSTSPSTTNSSSLSSSTPSATPSIRTSSSHSHSHSPSPSPSTSPAPSLKLAPVPLASPSASPSGGSKFKTPRRLLGLGRSGSDHRDRDKGKDKEKKGRRPRSSSHSGGLATSVGKEKSRRRHHHHSGTPSSGSGEDSASHRRHPRRRKSIEGPKSEGGRASRGGSENGGSLGKHGLGDQLHKLKAHGRINSSLLKAWEADKAASTGGSENSTERAFSELFAASPKGKKTNTEKSGEEGGLKSHFSRIAAVFKQNPNLQDLNSQPISPEQLRMTLGGVTTEKLSGSKHTVYHFNVEFTPCRGTKKFDSVYWGLARRFKQFEDFHDALGEQFDIQFADFPSKKMVGSVSMDKKKDALLRFVTGVRYYESACNSSLFLNFLDFDSHYPPDNVL